MIEQLASHLSATGVGLLIALLVLNEKVKKMFYLREDGERLEKDIEKLERDIKDDIRRLHDKLDQILIKLTER